MRQGIILLFGLFVILGCGYQETSTQTPIPSPTTIPPKTHYQKILPSKISVGFPKILKNRISYTSENSQLEEKKNTNLNQLEKDIYKIEDAINISELNLILLKQVMPEIVNRCDGLESCIFDDRELSFLLDEKIIKSIDKILGTKQRDFLDKNNTLVHLGRIKFSKYENQKYEYELNFNMLHSSFLEQNSSIQEQKQLFKWSNSSNDVIAISRYSDEHNSVSTTIRYFINSQGNELMYISDNNDTNISIENTTLFLKKVEDNNSYALTSNTTIQQVSQKETNTSHFSTNIEIDEHHTQLLLLDKNSTRDRTVEGENPADSVPIATKPILITGSVGGTLDIVAPENLSFDEEDNNLTLFVFEVNTEGLPSGDYLLLSPDTDIEEFDLEQLLDASIGSFSVMEGKPQGSLYNNEFVDRLDELIIVKIMNPQESTENSDFIVIENKPKLNIVKK